jgi:RNA polymerase sigma factor (sigma-70 family)
MSANELIPREADDSFLAALDAAARHEPGALERLLAGYNHVIKTAIANVLYNQDDRDDCYQELVEKVWKAIPRFRAPEHHAESAFGAWLKVSATRKALDFKEKIATRTPEGGFIRSWVPDTEDGSQDSPTVVVPDEGFEDDIVVTESVLEVRRWLGRALMKLPVRQAVAFRYVVQHSLTYQEAAERMTARQAERVTVSAVKSLVQRARVTVRDLFVDHVTKTESREKKRQYMAQNRDMIRETRRRWDEQLKRDFARLLRVRQRKNANRKAWRERNPEQAAEISRMSTKLWRQRNPSGDRASRKRDIERKRNQRAVWRESDPVRYAAFLAKKRAQQKAWSERLKEADQERYQRELEVRRERRRAQRAQMREQEPEKWAALLAENAERKRRARIARKEAAS